MHTDCASVFQFRLDITEHLLVREPVLGSKLQEILFLVRGQLAVGNGEGQEFVKLSHRFFVRLSGELVVHHLATFWIEKLNARFGKITR